MSGASTCDVDSRIVIKGHQLCAANALNRKFMSRDSCASQACTNSSSLISRSTTSTNTIVESSDAKQVSRKKYYGRKKRSKERHFLPAFSKRAKTGRGVVQAVQDYAKLAYDGMPCWKMGINSSAPHVAQNCNSSSTLVCGKKKRSCKEDSCAIPQSPCCRNTRPTCCMKTNLGIPSQSAFPNCYPRCAKKLFRNDHFSKRCCRSLPKNCSKPNLHKSPKKRNRLKKSQKCFKSFEESLLNSSSEYEYVKSEKELKVGNFSSPVCHCTSPNCPFCATKNRKCPKRIPRRPGNDSLNDLSFKKASSKYMKPSCEPALLNASESINSLECFNPRLTECKTPTPNQSFVPQNCLESDMSTGASLPSIDSQTSPINSDSIIKKYRKCSKTPCNNVKGRSSSRRCIDTKRERLNSKQCPVSPLNGCFSSDTCELGSTQSNKNLDCGDTSVIVEHPEKKYVDNAIQCTDLLPTCSFPELSECAPISNPGKFKCEPPLGFSRKPACPKSRKPRCKRLKICPPSPRLCSPSLSNCTLLQEKLKKSRKEDCKKVKALKALKRIQALKSCRRKMCLRELRKRRNRSRELARRIRPKDKKFYCLW